MTCGGCGFEAAAEFAYCPRCGRRLGTAQEAAAPHADRRPVTVLFADLSGFTALGEQLDPEDVRALQNDLYAEMSATIERFDGFVEKYVGDAVMAVFGAPVAHDEDPERAVRAAIAMQQRVAALSDAWMPRLGQPLALHIGINTGPVVAGHIGAGQAHAYAVTGDTVNAASRLQNAAGPGQIVVSRSTYLLTQHAFRFESLGALSLKGKAQPLQAYRLDAALATPGATRGLQGHGLAAPLIGRERELDALAQALNGMLAGRTQLVSIIAEAGSGKTRLLSEFVARLQVQGDTPQIAVRRAACSSLGEQTYGVPASLLRDAYGLADDDAPTVARVKIAAALASMGANVDEIERVSSFLGVVLGLEAHDASARHLDPEQLQRQFFLAVQTVVERRLQVSPLLLIVEDLHWTDAASVELLRFLLDALPERRFMLLVTHRPSPALEILGAADTTHTVLRLEPLTPAQSEHLLDALFGTSGPALPAELRRRVVEHAGGNPLFLEEQVRALIAEGVLQTHEGRWVWQARAAAMQVPLTIHGLLLARIDQLPSRAREALLEAAVIGPVFDERLLGVVAADPATLPQALDLLEGAGLVSRDERRYRFRHGLFQEVAYENLLASRRTELHTRIGVVLERECDAAPQRLEELEALAHHFRLSSDKAKGVRYLVLAGDWARSIYANADAIRHYGLALQTLDASDALTRLAVQERLADVLAPIGQSTAAIEHLATARDGYAQRGDLNQQARMLRKLAALRWETGARDEARRCLEAGLALIDEAAPHIERAKLYQEMGQLAFRSGDNAGAMRWTQRALDAVEQLAAAATDEARRDMASTIALTLNTQGVTFARLDRLEEAVARLERSVSIARDADLPQAECRALSNLGVLYSSRDPRLAIDACERGLQTAQRVGDLGLQSRLYANLAVAYCTLTNRCDERGVGAANIAIEIDRRAGQLDHLAVSLVVLGQIYQCHGEPKRALGHYREALALAETTAEPQLLFPCYDGLATLYLDLDDYAEAERYMQLAREICERAGIDPDALVVLPFLT
jgi:adenylate cyclase